jgi:hypothetical protein
MESARRVAINPKNIFIRNVLTNASGWKVARIREHELKASPMRCIRKIMAAMRPEKA